MSGDLKLLVAVLPEAQPVIDALNRLHRDIGSIELARLGVRDPPADARCLCVTAVDQDDVAELATALARELAGNPAALALCNRAVLKPLPLGAVLVAFLDCIAIKA